MRGSNWILALVLVGAALPLQAQRPLPRMPAEQVVVTIWPGTDQCTVLMRKSVCSRVPGLLQGQLQVSRDRRIIVTMRQDDIDSLALAQRVATDLKASGYRYVTLVDASRNPRRDDPPPF
jgi:hypothetical protein